MSSVLPISPEEELRQRQVEYNTLLKEQSDFLKKDSVIYGTDPDGKSLKNSEYTFEKLISPKEMDVLSLAMNPNLLDLHLQIYPEETREQTVELSKKIMQRKVLPYARAPVTYNMEERHPEYMEAKRNYQKSLGSGYGYTRQYPGNRPEDIGQFGPMEPANLDMRKKLAALGWDPDTDQYSNPILNKEGNPFGRGTKLKMGLDMALNSRFMSPNQMEYVLSNNGIEVDEGSVRYVDPMEPSMGIAFKPKGEAKDKIYDLPVIEFNDALELLIQEGPIILADVVGTGKASKMLDALETANPIKGPFGKAMQILGLSGASGLSAGVSDAVRMGFGAAIGANNLTGEEIIKEAGLIGLLSTGGTAVVSIVARAVPYILETLAGKQVPPSFYKALEDAQKRVAASAKGEKLQPTGMYSEEIPMKDIYEFVDDLGKQVGTDFRNIYQPSLSARTQSSQIAAMEQIFLKNADRPGAAQTFQAIKDGNKEVINRMFGAMQNALGKDILSDVTAAELGQATRVYVTEQSDQLMANAQEALENTLITLRNDYGSTDTIAVQSLLDEVPMTGRTTEMFPRTNTRLEEIRSQYLEPYSKAYDDAINSSKYSSEVSTVTGGAGYTSKPMDNWVNINKRNADRLFKEGGLDSPGAVQELQELVSSKSTIIRLRGREPVTKLVKNKKTGQFEEVIVAGKFKKPNFSLKELDEARVDLNKFASETQNQTARGLARSLEQGIEKQMYATIRSMAKEKSGLSGKALDDYMESTGYGKEITDAWVSRSKALANANSDFYLSLVQQPSERVIGAILRTNVKGAKNTKIAPVIEMLEATGSKELGDVRRSMVQYIRSNVVGVGEKTPLEQAKAYREFWSENKGTMEVLYGKDTYKSFPTLKQFQENVVRPIEEADAVALELKKLFDVDNPRATTGNIISDVLESGSTARSSGEAILNQQRIIEVIKNSPELSKNMGEVAQSWLVRKVVKKDPSMPGQYSLDLDELTRLLYDDFSTTGTSGPKLTFENFFAPFMGKGKTVNGKVIWDDAQGRKYVDNLKFIHAMLEREAGIPLTNPGILAKISQMIESVLPQTGYIRRTMLPVLSVIGRRARVAEEVIGQRSAAAFGEILLNDQALDASVQYLKGKYETEKFLRLLSSYGIVAYMDIGNEEKLYNETTKEFSDNPYDYAVDNLKQLTSGGLN